MPELIGVPNMTYVLVAAALAIIYLFPRVTKAIPSPLVAIVAITAVVLAFGIDVRTVGDMGQLPSSFPSFFLPDVPFNLETLRIILPYSVAIALVGLLESLMTAQVVDDLTDTGSDKNRECFGQGIANFVTGFFGGMAGCAMIGQSGINIRSGGRGAPVLPLCRRRAPVPDRRTRDWVAVIPMPALVAIMIMVSIGTFDWGSLKSLVTHPRRSSVVMLTVVVIVVWSHNLALGVFAGVLLSGLFFASKIAQIFAVSSTVSADGSARTYVVEGQVFFASAGRFLESFDFREPLSHVTIDVSRAHIWDLTGVGRWTRRC